MGIASAFTAGWNISGRHYSSYRGVIYSACHPHDATLRKLDKPPIFEALLDFRVIPGDSTESVNDLFDKLAAALKETYPHVREPVKFTRLSQPDSQPLKALRWENEYRFSSKAGEKHLLVTQNQFTFSHTFSSDGQTYSSWAKFFEEARAAWELYENALNPRSLVRLGTRFVNKFETTIEKALNAFESPISAPLEDAGVHHYRDMLTGSTRDNYGFRTGRRIEPTGTPQRVIIFMDVEASKTLDVSCPVDFALLESDIARLRDIKNDLFFESLTENALIPFGYDS